MLISESNICGSESWLHWPTRSIQCCSSQRYGVPRSCHESRENVPIVTLFLEIKYMLSLDTRCRDSSHSQLLYNLPCSGRDCSVCRLWECHDRLELLSDPNLTMIYVKTTLAHSLIPCQPTHRSSVELQGPCESLYLTYSSLRSYLGAAGNTGSLPAAIPWLPELDLLNPTLLLEIRAKDRMRDE